MMLCLSARSVHSIIGTTDEVQANVGQLRNAWGSPGCCNAPSNSLMMMDRYGDSLISRGTHRARTLMQSCTVSMAVGTPRISCGGNMIHVGPYAHDQMSDLTHLSDTTPQ